MQSFSLSWLRILDLRFSVLFSLSCGQHTHWNAGFACVKSLMSFGGSNDVTKLLRYCALLSNTNKLFSETDTCHN